MEFQAICGWALWHSKLTHYLQCESQFKSQLLSLRPSSLYLGKQWRII